MNNYDLHERAQELADTHSAYELARQLLELKSREVKITGDDLATVPIRANLASTTACDDQFAADPNGGDHD